MQQFEEEKDELTMVPSICVENKIKNNKSKSGEIVDKEISHTSGNCDLFMAGAVNVECDVNAQRSFSNSAKHIVDVNDASQFNMFEQKENIFATVVTTNICKMLFGEKLMKKKQNICCFNGETNSVESMTSLC